MLTRTAIAGLLALGSALLAPPAPATAQAYSNAPERAPADEVIYFLLPDRFENGERRNDRGGVRGARLANGYDPTHKGFYHGGDLAGLTRRLDYIEALGATAVWLSPIFRNKPVQGPPGQESAGYHGYWVTDFTDIDPHLGTREQFRAFVDAAHARGLKVYMDIITNHTADVIQYRECPNSLECPYRSRADFPYTRLGGIVGAPINPGFSGDDGPNQTAENFARLINPNYAYTAFVPAREARVKVPAWLNETIYYHNRGNTHWTGESTDYGDFSGLDDIFTEHPRVLAGLIEVYGRWIDDFGVDGFRVDTAKHVNSEFWRAFVPAMRERARARGAPDFHIFAEEAYTNPADPGSLAAHTRVDGFPAVLDFAFQEAVRDMIAGEAGTERLARLREGDALYEGGDAAALSLPIFIGNHDMGRFAHFVLKARPTISDRELYERVRLAHALMMFWRGAPVIYYGDEQGFTGDGGDQDAREDMFATQVASYADNRIVGAHAPAEANHFDTSAPLFRDIAAFAAVRAANAPLRRGRLVIRASADAPGLGAFSRLHAGAEALVAFNTSDAPVSAHVVVDTTSKTFRSLIGACAPAPAAPGAYHVDIPARDFVVCIAEPAP